MNELEVRIIVVAGVLAVVGIGYLLYRILRKLDILDDIWEDMDE